MGTEMIDTFKFQLLFSISLVQYTLLMMDLVKVVLGVTLFIVGYFLVPRILARRLAARCNVPIERILNLCNPEKGRPGWSIYRLETTCNDATDLVRYEEWQREMERAQMLTTVGLGLAAAGVVWTWKMKKSLF